MAISVDVGRERVMGNGPCAQESGRVKVPFTALKKEEGAGSRVDRKA